MGRISTIDKLPKKFHNKVVEMLADPALTQQEIMKTINAEAGETLITKSSLNRFVIDREKITGSKRGKIPPTAEESLTRIASALERIAFSLKK
jgi:hypothetical protein